jgi:perosamine synthetase
MRDLIVPFLRPDLRDPEVQEVVATLRSGWLTTGPRVRLFEERFRAAVNARHAIAVNSCTAALHLAIEALGLKRGDAVLVPTMTFAATAEVVRYQGAMPVLVDCDPVTLNMDLVDAEGKLEKLRSGALCSRIPPDLPAVGILPVHVGGLMMDVDAVREFAMRHRLWTVEDAAHAFPAAWRRDSSVPWQQCGESTAAVTCFSFYANKTITTGEGGMIVTDDDRLAARMRMMSLHGLSTDAWDRYSGDGTWDYRILGPGFKYNMTDMAAAIGLHQLMRANEMRERREAIARRFFSLLADVDEIELPIHDSNRVHAWHLFPIRLQLHKLALTRHEFIMELRRRGIGSSVHWRPLHLHPYYQESFGWEPHACPIATKTWERLVSLPVFSSMREEAVVRVCAAVRSVCARHLSRSRTPSALPESA